MNFASYSNIALLNEDSWSISTTGPRGSIEHSVESPTGTFIVGLNNVQLKRWQVAEVNTGGEMLRLFGVSRLPPLARLIRTVRTSPLTLSHGNIVVADKDNRRILLLDAHLSLCRLASSSINISSTTRNRGVCVFCIILPNFVFSFRGRLRKSGWLAINRFSLEKCHKVHQLSTTDAFCSLR